MATMEEARFLDSADVISDAAPPAPPQPADEGSREQGVAELALYARLKARPDATVTEAAEEIAWALAVARQGPAGLDPRKPRVSFASLLRSACTLLAALVLVVLLLLWTKGIFQELSVRNGVLIAANAPGAPPAAVASAMESRRLSTCAALPADTLRNVKDVVLVQAGTWRRIRVARVQKFSNAHILLEGADGSAVRVRGQQAFLRGDPLGDENPLALEGELYKGLANATASQLVVPTAYFEVAVSTQS